MCDETPDINKPGRREFLRLASLSALTPAVSAPAEVKNQPNPAKPNIIVIMADQHHAGLTKRSGFPLDTMPALDRLAEGGVSFDRAYTCAPLCVPSRVSMLTGRWPHAHRVRQNSAAADAIFEKDIFDVVKDLGYKTGLAGKNHSYLKPGKLNFWRQYSRLGGWTPRNPSKEVVDFDQWLLIENFATELKPAPFAAEVQHPYRIVSDAMEFIQSNSGQPFALWVSFPEPHNPYQAPEPYFSMFPPDQAPQRKVGPEALDKKGFKWHWLRELEQDANPGYDLHWRRTRSNYLGMLRLIDDQIGRLVNFLDQRKLRENTLIVYLSDHGDYFCDYGLVHKGVGLPEDLVRVPMVWSGAGIATQGAIKDPFVSSADIMPTLCEALGVGIPHGAQGRSLWPMLRKQAYPQEEFRSIYSEVGFGGMYYDRDDHVPKSIAEFRSAPNSKLGFDELDPVTQSGNLKMVRMGDWKLLFDMMGNGELYNLAADPYELENLFQNPSAAAERNRLLQELLAWTIRTEDDLPVAAYKTKWPKRNWYAPYRHGGPPA